MILIIPYVFASHSLSSITSGLKLSKGMIRDDFI